MTQRVSDERRAKVLADLDEGANYITGLYQGLPQEVEQRFLKAVIEARGLITNGGKELECAEEHYKKVLNALTV